MEEKKINLNRCVLVQRYWADVFSSLREAQQIAKSVNPEFALLWERIRQFLDDCFIETAQLPIIERWEKIVGVNAEKSDTLNDRRDRVLRKMQVMLMSYDLWSVRHVFLAGIVGEGNYKVTVDPVDCTVEVLINPAKQSQMDEVKDLLKVILPANMVLTMGVMGTSHNTLEQYTHNELANYSHDQIRDELLFLNKQ